MQFRNDLSTALKVALLMRQRRLKGNLVQRFTISDLRFFNS